MVCAPFLHRMVPGDHGRLPRPGADAGCGPAARTLLFTHEATGPRGAAHERITVRAAVAFGTAFHSSGGDNGDAHEAGLHNVLQHIAPGVAAFVLHHLGAVLPDLTPQQWERVDAVAVALDLRVCEDLSAAETGG